MIYPIRAESIRTLYSQARNSALAALVVTVYMAAWTWQFSDHRVILGWVAAQLAAQLIRILFVLKFLRSAVPDERLETWARLYTFYMLVAGIAWGASAFLFVDHAHPITISLTLCGLFGIAAGSVPGNAYNPNGLYAFVSAIFLCVLVDLILQNRFVYVVLGIASVAFAVIMMLFCRVQAATIADGFRIRFENLALVAQLKIQRADADAARIEAERANLAKSQFLAAASHDLRQPLHALSLLTGTLKSLVRTTAADRLVAEMLSNVKALAGLFNGLLDIARLDAGITHVERVPLPCDELFDQLSTLLRATSQEATIDLRFRSDGSTLFTDPVVIQQILLNLAANAIQNTAKGGLLCVARRRGDRIRLEVWDTGTGIAPDDLARIFDEFVQVGNVERRRSRGMGLGLAIAQRSAALLGTRIEVASVPGRGSVFWFYDLPADAHVDIAPVESVRPRPTRAAAAAMKVLVIDDDIAVLRAVELLLTEWNVPARFARSSDEAVAIASDERFSHILSDFRLPGSIDGIDLLKLLKVAAGAEDTQFCLVTGDMSADLLARADRERLQLLHKPMSSEGLHAVLFERT